MTILARGTFDVNITPQPPEDKSEGLTLGRMLIETDGKHSYEFAYTLPEDTRT
jgi:hypothetical protein